MFSSLDAFRFYGVSSRFENVWAIGSVKNRSGLFRLRYTTISTNPNRKIPNLIFKLGKKRYIYIAWRNSGDKDN